MIEIPVLVASAWTTLQPFLPVIATKAAEEIGKTSVDKIWTAIEKKFETKAAAKEAMQDVLKNPQDADSQGAFRLQLKKLLEEDNAFVSDLTKLLESAGSIEVGKGGVYVGGSVSGSNIITGNNNSINAEKNAKKK